MIQVEDPSIRQHRVSPAVVISRQRDGVRRAVHAATGVERDVVTDTSHERKNTFVLFFGFVHG